LTECVAVLDGRYFQSHALLLTIEGGVFRNRWQAAYGVTPNIRMPQL